MNTAIPLGNPKPRHFLAFVYAVLWGIGALYALSLLHSGWPQLLGVPNNAIESFFIFSYWSDTRVGKWAWLVFFCVTVSTAIHQAFIYMDYHDMEKNPSTWASEFPGWFDTKPEICIRGLAFFTLLSAAGKLYFLPQWLEFEDKFPDANLEVAWIAASTATLYSLHLLWDAWSIVAFCLNHSAPKPDAEGEEANSYLKRIGIQTVWWLKQDGVHIGYLLTDAGGAILWACIAYGLWDGKLDSESFGAILGFGFLYCFLVLARCAKRVMIGLKL